MVTLCRSGEGDTTGFVDWKTQKENTSSVVNCILTSTQKYSNIINIINWFPMYQDDQSVIEMYTYIYIYIYIYIYDRSDYMIICMIYLYTLNYIGSEIGIP